MTSACRLRTLLLLSVASVLLRPCSPTPFISHRRPSPSRLTALQRGGGKTCSTASLCGGTSAPAGLTVATPARHHGPKACRIFLWDAVSAGRFALCMRMLRENLYEGLGGRKFVRIRPGSLLQSLYPCSDHAPDRCAICGFSFPDHLGEWWKPWLWSPYDVYLNRISEKGIILPEDKEDAADGRGWRGGKRRRGVNKGAANGWGAASVWPTSAKVLCFHRRYVDQVVPPSANSRLSGKRHSSHFDNEGYEYRHESNVHYRIPVIQNGPKNSLGKRILTLIRAITIDEVDNLLWLQERENSKLQREEDEKIRL